MIYLDSGLLYSRLDIKAYVFQYSSDPRPANYFAGYYLTLGPPRGHLSNSFELTFHSGDVGNIPPATLLITPQKSKSPLSKFFQFEVSVTDRQYTGYLAIELNSTYERWREFFVVAYPWDSGTNISYQDWIFEEGREGSQNLKANLPGRWHFRRNTNFLLELFNCKLKPEAE